MRVKEAMASEQPFRRVPQVPSPDKLIDMAFKRATRTTVKVPTRRDRLLIAKLKEIAKIRVVSSLIIERLKGIKDCIPIIENLHPFYRDMFYLVIDSNRFKIAMARVSKASKLIEKLAREYIVKVRSSTTPTEALRLRREFYGRVASIIKELDSDLQTLSNIEKLRRLPSFNFNVPIIIVSGAPNVGKSSFVKCVSTAEPEIAEYPFTTKSVSVGHIIGPRGFIAQIVDTPGLLDRPLEERNKIELQAIIALKNLEGGVVFLIDPTETCGYSLEYQLNVLRSVKEMFKEKPMVVALTKIDIATKEQIQRAQDKLKGEKVFTCNTLECVGVREVVDELLRMVRTSDRS
ncbi:MAG: 50S ribosome-binding GTPase [Candidatus Nezhaarchaeota archaeon]|nr:50S ribosome-binding GTPase [Candidatus Nezhaarchaeota archaeon]